MCVPTRLVVQDCVCVFNMCVLSYVCVQVWKISVQGSCYLSLLMVATGLLWGQVLHIRPTQTVFISSCLSLSSTPLVSRFLAGGARADKDGTETMDVCVCERQRLDFQCSLF